MNAVRAVPTNRPTITQRVARGLFVGVCGMLAVGVLGAAADRAVDATSATATGHALVAMATDRPTGGTGNDKPAAPLANRFSPATVTVERRREPARPRVLWMEVTAYCPCKKCCGPQAQGITASGKRVTHNKGRFVAADTRVLPFGTKLSIPGYHGGRPVPVLDRGGAIKGHKLDVYFPSHQTAKQWGRRWVPVTVVE